jgi:hypothetical protein
VRLATPPAFLCWWLLLSAGPAGAQGVSVRLGGVDARYADSVAGAAAAASLHGTLTRGAFRAAADLWHARFTGGAGSTTQAAANLTAFRSLSAPVAGGLRAVASASFLSGGTTAWTASAEAFVALLRGGWLATAGGSAGGLRDIAGAERPAFGAFLGAQRALGALSLETRVAATWSRTTRYADVTGGAEWARGRLTLGADAGARIGDLGGDALLQAHAELRLLPALSLEASAGSFLRDLTGFVSGRFVNAGVRIALAREAAPRAAPRVRVEALAECAARVTFEVPGAASVAIVGEWNQWQPAPLVRVARGRWQVVLPLARGAYRFSLVVDGERWIVPAGVPRLPDDFGGEVGILVIEG